MRMMNKGVIKKCNNSGMTMVEILVGFVILIVMMGMLSGIISFARNMYINSVDLKRSQEAIQKEIYKKDFAKGTGAIKTKEEIIMTPIEGMPDGGSISLDMDVVKVSVKDALDGDESSLDVELYMICEKEND